MNRVHTALNSGRLGIASIALAVLLPASACAQPTTTPTPAPADQSFIQAVEKAQDTQGQADQIVAGVYDVEIVATYPHDTEAFTQGLLWHRGALYESTGQEGRSQVRRVDLASGKVLQRSSIPDDQFGEGVTALGDDLISLTWQNGVVHRWNAADLALQNSTDGYSGEGWGITTLNDELYVSDGSDALRVIDPTTYRVKKTIPVRMNGEPINMLNELEAIDGYIFANIFTTRYIVGINPTNGNAEVIIDLESLPTPATTNPEAVLNGIAWDQKNRRMFVTGKMWDKLYEVRLVPKPVE